MGNPKHKWTQEEEDALRAGIAKHGTGKWKTILVDPEFAPFLSHRTNVDLKDKWRNMGTSFAQGSKDRSIVSLPKEIAAAALAAPKAEYVSPLMILDDEGVKVPSESRGDVKNAPACNVMILEALSSIQDSNGADIRAIAGYIEQKYEVSQNFRKLLSSNLRRLCTRGKLEKVENNYKIKDVDIGSKIPIPKQNEVRTKPLRDSKSIIDHETEVCSPRPLHESKVIRYRETVEDAAKTAAYRIAEAENKSFMAAETVKESEIVLKMAEEADAMVQLCEDIVLQCSRGENFILA